MTTKKPASPAAEEKPVKALIVSAHSDGFRRAGRAWSKAPTEVVGDELSIEQVAELLAEPNLDVTFVTE
jgi:hypothetical protein